ncbi:MAG: hypothetical protein IPL35_17845 [Sphingobacteriales bacterium]|nr:hypothetical protein [Sphingobacteriales bacterium]
MDACNQVAADTISVVLDDDCVWLGDANNDNIVNYLDLLPGLNYGDTGAGQMNASLNWEAQSCP